MYFAHTIMHAVAKPSSIFYSMKFSKIFKEFLASEKASGFVLIGCTAVSLLIANSGWGETYTHFFHHTLNLSFFSLDLNYSVEHWINDGLMAIFFLLVGLEIERELYIGELSTFKNALLPVLAAAGGMLFPALIHFAFNAGTDTQAGFWHTHGYRYRFRIGYSIAGRQTHYAIAKNIPDGTGHYRRSGCHRSHCTILYKGIFHLLFRYCIAGIPGFIYSWKEKNVFNAIYLLGGIIMWYCMLKSGVHATIAGVLLAFAIPFQKKPKAGFRISFSILTQTCCIYHFAHICFGQYCYYFPEDLRSSFSSNNATGIIAGLVLGKFAGIFVVSWLAVKTKLAQLSDDLQWGHLLGVSLLGGIGFTMSIFITNLAFTDATVVTASKMSILLASVTAAVLGLLILKTISKRKYIQPELAE